MKKGSRLHCCRLRLKMILEVDLLGWFSGRQNLYQSRSHHISFLSLDQQCFSSRLQ
jgi:hypothetical protein